MDDKEISQNLRGFIKEIKVNRPLRKNKEVMTIQQTRLTLCNLPKTSTTQHETKKEPK